MAEKQDEKKGEEVKAEAPVFDRKHLAGLTFKTSEVKEVKGEDGKPGKQFIPKETSLKPEHVLDWKDNGNHVVIVTADGRKHTVKKDQK